MLSTSRSTPAPKLFERRREHLDFVVDGNFVGTLRGRQDRDHDANDGHGDNDANRDHHAQAGAIPTGVLPLLRIG